jgi:hypothetical protein
MELQYNSLTGNYEAPVEGGTLIVEGDTFSESYPGEAPEEAYSPVTWLNCVDGEAVRVEQQ